MSALVKADGVTPLTQGSQASRTSARYLRDTGSGVVAARIAPMTQHRDDIRHSWSRVAGLAMDMFQNSGRLKGAVDQVMADTVGVCLQCSPNPDLTGLGFGDEERSDLIATFKREWNLYWKSATEFDARGKLTGPQSVDIGMRWYLAYGEVTGVFDFFDQRKRDRYGVKTGTKLRLYSPQFLVQDTNQIERMFQGVQHDESGRAVAYRFLTSASMMQAKKDFRAYDAEGRRLVMHVFDPVDADDVRGISPIAAAMRKHIQAEMLDDAALQMAILQTLFAVTLTSESPSAQAFEALETFETEVKGAGGYGAEFVNYLKSSLGAAAESKISVGSEPQVSHLAPGETLDFKTAGVPGRDHIPFSNNMSRDMARAIGVTYGGFTMDHENASYSSSRMEYASIWPVVMRRRERVAAPICQQPYEHFLDEMIGEGRIPFKGGYEAFLANRERVSNCGWQGPAKPSADDQRSAKASSERLDNGTSSIEIEMGDLGLDPDQVFEQRKVLHQKYLAAGMTSPYERRSRAPSEPSQVDEEK